MWSHRYVYHDEGLEHKIRKLVQGVHVILHGPEGTGLFSFVQTALHDAGIMPSTVEWAYEDVADKKLRVMTRSNNRCVEIVMKDYGSNERYLLHTWIRQMSESFTISNDAQLGIKLVVIHNVEWFSKESQNVLAIFAEKHSHCTRYLFTTHKWSLVNRSLKSQCTHLRIPRPDPEKLVNHIERILVAENASLGELQELVTEHDAHLENTVDAAQMAVFGAKSTFDQAIHEMYQTIRSKKANKLKPLRDLMYTLLVNNMSATLIFKALLDVLCVRETKCRKQDIVRAAAVFESRLSACERPVYHLEAFFAHILTLTP